MHDHGQKITLINDSFSRPILLGREICHPLLNKSFRNR